MTTSNETTTLARYRRELAALADDALTTDEVARRLGVSRRRVQLLLHDGRLPYAEAVGQRWVRAADLAVDPRMPTGIYRDPATPRGFARKRPG